MFKLVGIKEILEEIIHLCDSFLPGIPNRSSLQVAFRNFLRKIQPSVPKPDGLDISLETKKGDIASLLNIFKQESFLDDFIEVFDASKSSGSNGAIDRVKLALSAMRELCPSFYELIHIVIHTIFSAPSKFAGGGSTSAAIGCIWIDFRFHWQEQDVLEFLVHETTHNLIFVDELCHTHYLSYREIAKKENYAWSAILNKSRPLDKVFHSIIVSTEILAFRVDHLGHPKKPCLHPPSDILVDQTKRSIHSILDSHSIERLLTERSKFLLNKCREKIENIRTHSLCAL